MPGKLEEAKGATAEIVGRAERAASDVAASVSDTAAKVRVRAQHAMGEVDVTSARDAVERHTRKNPLLALLLAGALGLLVGRLVLPKHK